MIVAGVIILQIDHINVKMLLHLTKQHVNELKIVFRKHWSSECVVL